MRSSHSWQMRGSTLAARATSVISALSSSSQPRRAASFAPMIEPPLPYSRDTVMTRYITDKMQQRGKRLQAADKRRLTPIKSVSNVVGCAFLVDGTIYFHPFGVGRVF